MSEIPEVDVAEAQRRLSEGALLLDVREPDEWVAGHAPDATHLPMSQFADRSGEIPTGCPLVVVCKSGGRSARVTEYLVDRGFDAVNLAGGMAAWDAAQLPMIAEGADPPRVA